MAIPGDEEKPGIVNVCRKQEIAEKSLYLHTILKFLNMKKTIWIILFLSVSFFNFAQNAGKSLNFDGSNDYVSIDTNFNISGGMSVELWFKTTTSTPSALFGQSKLLPTVNPGSFVPTIAITSSGKLRAEYWTGALGDITTSFSVNDGKWHHVAFTTSVDTQTLYVDGVKIGSRAGSLLQNWWHYTQIGTGYDAGTRLGGSGAWRYAAADIDEVRVWDTILPEATVRDWMYRSLNPTHPFYSSLRGYYKFNEGTGSTSYDSSTYKFDGSMKNFGSAPWSASYVPMISIPTLFKNNTAAVWPAKSSNSSSVMSISSGISGSSYVVFGHNNNPLNYNTVDKPSFIQKRLSRSWRVEKEGSVTADFVFDYALLDTTGFNSYKLLISSDTSFSNASIKDGVKTGYKKIKFSNVTVQDSFYYTIGAYDFQKPTVKLKSFDKIKAFRAEISGEVVDDGGKYTIRGICWSTTSNPDTSLSTKIISGSGNGVFKVNISNLSANTTYHVRAFAYNAMGLSYSNDTTFTTPSATLPSVQTIGLLNLYVDSVLCAAKITSDGNDDLTQCGLCWSVNPNPTVSLSSKVILGNDTGTYLSIIKNLNRGTKYYIRAFATNSIGTSYGGDSTFITAGPPEVVINNINSIGYYTANVESEITNSGQKPILEKGICWSTQPNPRLKTAAHKAFGSGMGKYSLNMTNLNANTLYYVSAYAINMVDTAYSIDSTFKTLKTKPPTVITSGINNITDKSALGGGNVTNDGGAEILYKGVCWSKNANPDLSLSTKTMDGKNLGAFTSVITGLSKGTTYHVRAYAINAYDTAYGGDTVFKTLDAAKVMTDSVTNISGSSATCGGTVTDDGGSYILRRGVCWAVFHDPAITNSSFTTDGFGKGHFTSTLSFLLPATTYYVRAYAINSTDTSYGNEVSFKTPSAPVVTTAAVTSVTGVSAVCGGNVVSGENVNARGVVWSKYPNPTIGLPTKTNDGSGPGVFSSNITNLTRNTKYYVRAYATNSIGTSYGNELSFTTADKATVVTKDPIIKNHGEVECGGNVVSDGGMEVTRRGVCWDTLPNPVVGLNSTDEGIGTGNFVSLLKGLNVDTEYFIRAYAINGVDTAYGEVKNFTITPPIAATGTSANITYTEADIYGTINARGQWTDIRFEYGLTPAYGNSFPGNPSSSSAQTSENINAHITGLTHNTTYHYRIIAENNHGISYGADSVFTTPFNSSIDGLNNHNHFIIRQDGRQITIIPLNNSDENYTLTLFDLLGNQLFSLNSAEKFSFIPDVPEALYILRISQKDKTFQFKLLIGN